MKDVRDRIREYIAGQPEPKRSEMLELHALIPGLLPGCRLWFLDGRDDSGRVVSNPNIGYGARTMRLAGGRTREFYQLGMSANTTGISIYVMGIEDRKYLAAHYAKRIGQAAVTGYCIKFRSLRNIDVGVLADALRDGIAQAGT